uniref:Uncharacterized protein n=1 Tax=Physcomitrium patens TaxID=3218 RepID=A0A7I3YXZ2_PHYPA
MCSAIIGTAGCVTTPALSAPCASSVCVSTHDGSTTTRNALQSRAIAHPRH